ncbi:MBL fold metallo-hydrolase [Nocardia cyriacigeorgica]|uniref:Probable polyketide biosynthesis zinc-dependent hydrolase BaeB n=1 Tax=Nocardia cyriacigeorgica TaxID=135487 RepID=A0A4U8W0I8_9NOCA|nr:MBL fold metallo-hydrolase [Nocardia cyriacigeorgica]MBF6097343.1 MBL fold metallo-hydrolase [Nocardia cyriacigeorgica]MBF6160921.1 MBL fold metallo-hydrolase [Nocardia cyriacigeorgica]MBF6201088.1 MBL fold metallo-hydrolase [Nocardia cyriacigeorgica]MBF6318749.1 MBL fold metallo-hydrolase [Nocardia cyriacigeorgica]MBF6513334.1 MBL fold metallo-hydrolase [Nocardia cyriacigeorgica]
MTRVERIVTSGQFCLDGGCWDVDNNIWLVGDDNEVMIIDAAHDARPILDAVAGRRVTAIVCTHAHNDHVTVAPQLSAATGAPIYLHPADDVLWQQTHPGLEYTALGDGQRIEAGTAQLEVLHTPGHSPGSCCLYLPELGELFSGDTLFEGGPGATGRSYSDYPTILASINDRLFALPDETVVHTGHGPDTTLGAERANVPASAGTES